MPVDSAVAYIRRMRSDADFRRKMNELSDDEQTSWAAIRQAGFEFTLAEFKAAQDELKKEHGISTE